MENTENINTEGMTVTSTGSSTTVTTDTINVLKQNEEQKVTESNPEVTEENKQATEEVTENTDNKEENTNTDESIQTEIDKHLEAEKDLKNDLSSKGINWEDLSKEYDEKGELSKETLEALSKAGYPKSVVDNYIAGLDALAEKFENTVKGFAGGDKSYSEMISYLQKQPDSVKKDFNDLISGGNLGAIKLAIKGIQAEMKATYGTSNPTMMRGQASHQSQAGFATQDDMVKAMSDPRYGVDRNYTNEVYAKVAKTSFIN